MSDQYAGQCFLLVQKICTSVLYIETGLLLKPVLGRGFCCKIKAGLATIRLTVMGCWLAVACGGCWVVCSLAGLRAVCGIGVMFV